jgi:CDP-diacylglycerol---serine O-phosphatidyltransferase
MNRNKPQIKQAKQILANQNKSITDMHASIKNKRRAIYLLPNAFTTAALFCGFFAIIQSVNGMFEKAAIAIFIAMVLDGLDGRVARMTHTQSAFGEQYDSLSDMLSFGVAPAILVYQWSLRSLGKWGWLVAFIYCAAAALRLARFNTNIGVVNKSYFQGLPSPAAAATVAGSVWVILDKPELLAYLHHWHININILVLVITLYAGLSMVSNLPFYSGKTIGFSGHISFSVLVLFLLIFVAVAIDPSALLFILFYLYALSGLIVFIYHQALRKGNPIYNI